MRNIGRSSESPTRARPCWRSGNVISVQMIKARRTDDEYLIRGFAHLYHAPAKFLVGDEMHMRQLGDGVADRVVDRAFRNLASVDVGDGHPASGRRHGRRQRSERSPSSTDNIRP